MRDIYSDMDRLDGEAGDAVDELLAGRGVAPGCELCDPSVGRTDGDPARGLVEDDLGLAGPGEPEPEERGSRRSTRSSPTPASKQRRP